MPNINDLLRDHVTLEVECIDRLYLNGYIPTLQTGRQLVSFLREGRGQMIPSPALLNRTTEQFVATVKKFEADNGVPLVKFEHGQCESEMLPKNSGHLFAK